MTAGTLYLYQVPVRMTELGWEKMVIAARSERKAKDLARDNMITSVVKWGQIILLGRVVQETVDEGLVATNVHDLHIGR